MSKYNITLAPEVRNVLEQGRTEIASTPGLYDYFLPAGQLERKLYESVNKVLAAAGGKWNRGSKSHRFSDDPREKLGLALETGKIIDLVAYQKKELNAFYTPPAIAGIAASYLGIGEGGTVLEPSAGEGSLALAAAELGAKVTCLEINPDACKVLRSLGLKQYERNFLEVNPATWSDRFDAVLMNPPFSKGQDALHVGHATRFLKRGGRLVSIIAKSFTFREDQIYRTFRNLFQQYNGQIQRELPEGTFRESGTNIATLIITLDK